MINELILKEKLDQILDKFCLTKEYNISVEKIIVSSPDFKESIGNSNVLIFISETINVPETAKVTISSADNFIVFSKTEFEELKLAEFEVFSNYLKVKTENFGQTFIPFMLKFIKIIPYRTAV